MTINYNIDHKYLDLQIFEKKLSSLQRLILLISLSQIAHFTKVVGSCHFRVNDMANDFGCHKQYITKSVKLLQDADLIRCIKPYQRKTQQPAIYVTTPNLKKQMKQLGHHVHQAGSPDAQGWVTPLPGKELVNNSKQKKNDLTSSPSLMKKVYTNNNKPGI